MRCKRWIITLFLLCLISACGGPAADVRIFIMSQSGIADESAKQLETTLTEKIGVSPTIEINASPIFNLQKMMVEVAAGGNGILIIPKEQFLSFTHDGGIVSLDGIAKPEDFPDGVFEIPVSGNKKEK